jgi:hypothetical protein
MTQTRKLAASLVADVVGYSRLAGADEGTLPKTSPAASGVASRSTIETEGATAALSFADWRSASRRR